MSSKLRFSLTSLLLIFTALLGAQDTSAQAGPEYQKSQPSDSVKGVPPEYMIIEGDILVRKELFLSKPSATWEPQLWPNGIVPFEFDANVTQQNQNLMLAAMAEWENVAHIDFAPRSFFADFLHIQNSTENSSFVGKQGGEQIVNIFNWNSRFIMAHELAHALGYWHEQSRPNRNNFVRINPENIQPGMEDNFERHDDAGAYGPYDFDSVMHYGQFAFSDNGQPTITVLPPNQDWQNRIGQRNHLSHFDTLTMSFLYPQPNWRFVDASSPPLFAIGTFLLPFTAFSQGATLTPAGGTLWIQPGAYNERGTFNRQMTIRAPLGNVVIGASTLALSTNPNAQEKGQNLDTTINQSGDRK